LSDGTVIREDVIKVLVSNGVSVNLYANGDISPDMYKFEFHGDIECRRMPARIGRPLLHYFERKYHIPIHLFYHIGEDVPPKVQ